MAHTERFNFEKGAASFDLGAHFGVGYRGRFAFGAIGFKYRF